MKITILGAGNVGGALGRKFSEAGHEVFFGVPNPSEHEDKKSFAQVGNVAEAAKEAKVILIAVPYDAVANALQECGDLIDKIVVDATNPLKFADNKLNLTIGFETSGAERIAELATGAKVVKCFNQTGFGNMAEPDYENGKPVMFVCGDEREANETVRKLAEEIAFEAIDAGNLKIARLLEPLAMLWIQLSLTTDLKRDFAFGLLRRKR